MFCDSPQSIVVTETLGGKKKKKGRLTFHNTHEIAQHSFPLKSQPNATTSKKGTILYLHLLRKHHSLPSCHYIQSSRRSTPSSPVVVPDRFKPRDRRADLSPQTYNNNNNNNQKKLKTRNKSEKI